ncbi:RagB/SusD family nutrient uptake outer membrane protein [uncultured Draconibacterium sp.]|uniref:RagB/SusD family nutrient uptake outer membrane protein n=1 Tax=uncultured Draconibacterium sp. TaxID=1573823 RepID=UPI0025E6AA29|nr:RagB/SusD family nutrient uptake outer membrane protein [uncultured Draconibacterium sp.]
MNLYKRLVILILVLASSSCSDDFLTKEPPGIDSENYFMDAKGIDALLIGTYAMVQGSSLWETSWGASIQNWTFGSGASDDAYIIPDITTSSDVNRIEYWDVAATNTYCEDKWKWAFGMGIFRANDVLRVLAKTTDITSEEETEFEAEARFLRALFYFEAWLVFGDYIPLIDENVKDPSSVSNVNDDGNVLNFIINDLKFAWENLPDTQEEVGRPTKYAAMALAARAYLEELEYAQAKPLLDEIIASGKYALMPNFFDNFRIEKNNNIESIFEIQATVNDVNESLNAEMGIGLNWPHGGDIGMCCGFHQTSQNLANAYKVDENGLPLFDTFNDTDLKNDQGLRSDEHFTTASDLLDPRIDWTISRRGIPFLDWGINRGYDWVRHQVDGGPYLPAIKTFFYKYQRYTLSTTTGWMTGINANNYRYLRYAHVLLWRAEVAAAEGDLPTALDLVNRIRQRAGNEVVMGKVLIDSLPESVYPWGEGTTDDDFQTGGAVDWDQPAANYKIGLYTSFANADEAMRAVQWEQRLEFATEGRRFFDLRRWDNLPNKIGGMSMAEVLNNFRESDLRIRSSYNWLNAEFTNDEKYMPVPKDQLEMQPGVLQQRPEYIGED